MNKVFWQCYYKIGGSIIIIWVLLFIFSLSTFAQPVNDKTSVTIASELSGVASKNSTRAHQEQKISETLPDPKNSVAPYLVIQLKYIKPEQAKTMFFNLMPNNQIQVETMNNKLIVIGSEDDLQTVQEIIRKIDTPPRQVMFEAQIIEISLVDLKNSGIDWGPSTMLPEAVNMLEGNAFRVQLGKSQYGVNLKAAFNHLLQNKKGRLLANPRIAALDGCTAQIMIGDKLAVESRQKNGTETYITVNYIDVGIKLEVTPTVHEDGTITTRIKPEVSNKTDETTSGNPNIRSRQAETMLRVKDGETIVLGGLIQRAESKDMLKFPILGDIPLIGQLFRSTNKEKRETELIILITPKLLD